MNPDDKLKAAALDYLKDAYHEEMPYVSSLQSFLAGAAYRDPEIKALLEIVSIQRKTLEWYTKECQVCACELVGGDGAPSGFLPYNENWERASQAITATDEKLKSIGVEI